MERLYSAGTRPSTGKGKPSKLWRLSTPSQSVPAVATPTPAVAPAPVVTTPPAPAPVIVPTEAIVVPANEPPPVVVPTPVIEPPPIVTPVAEPPVAVETPVVATAPVETPVTVEVLRIEAPAANPMPEVKIDPVAEAKQIVETARTLTEVCPICGKPLLANEDGTGVIVWCGQSREICPSAEAPFGHAKTEKEAYEKLMDRWTRKSRVVSVGSERIAD